MSDESIRDCIDRWHRAISGELGLDDLLHPDCVFLSPIVFTPQRGREVTKLYLRAAGSTLAPTDDDQRSGEGSGSGGGSAAGPFRYTKQILQGYHAMLEFETEVDGKHVNGVDIITCDDDGAIVEFKVMIRPLQAVNAVHAQMMAALEALR